MSIHANLTTELDYLKTTLDISKLSKADTALLREKWEGKKKMVQGLFQATTAEISNYARAIQSEEDHLANTAARLIKPTAALQTQYRINYEQNVKIKAGLEQRLVSQEQMLERIENFLGHLPVDVPETRSCYSTLFNKQTALIALGVGAGLIGFATRHFINI
jgi:hypothetical protein